MSGADGRIVWHRSRSYIGSALRWTIRIDDQARGTVRNGGTLALDIGAGEHSIQVGVFLPGSVMKSNRLMVRIEAGQEVKISSSPRFTKRIGLLLDKVTEI
jgi:hypothetical protein